MNKSEAISKINKLGKISNIIVSIARVIMIVGLVFCIVGTVILMFVPKGLVQLNISGRTDVLVDLSRINVQLSEEEQQDILLSIQEDIDDENSRSTIDVNGNTYGTETVAVDESSIMLGAEAESYTVDIKNIIFILFFASLTLALLVVTLTFAGKLCKGFRDCESPFEENIIKKMNHLAYSLIPWAFVSTISNSIEETFFTNNATFLVGVDLGIIIVIFFIFILAYIFKYGAVLQQESDETL